MKYTEYDLNNAENFRFSVRKWIPETTPKGLVLLIHGHSDHGGRFKIVAQVFLKEGFIFVAPDLRGNGKTDGKRGHFDTLDQMLADIKFLLEECKKSHPGIPVILYSQSMGGNLAINYVLRFPEDIKCVVASTAVSDGIQAGKAMWFERQVIAYPIFPSALEAHIHEAVWCAPADAWMIPARSVRRNDLHANG